MAAIGAVTHMWTTGVWLHTLSQPLYHESHSTYQKGDLFCVRDVSGRVWKYPISNIFRIVEYDTPGPMEVDAHEGVERP